MNADMDIWRSDGCAALDREKDIRANSLRYVYRVVVVFFSFIISQLVIF